MITDALIQGAVSGGIATFTIFMFTRYLLPRIDKVTLEVAEIKGIINKCKVKE